MIRMTMRALRTFILPIGLLAIPLFSVPSTALAAKPKPTPPGNHLNITKVAVDFDAETLTITGEQFSFVNTLEVTLGEFGLLNIVTTTDTEIVVDFPGGGLPDGDYLLTVSRGTGQSQNDEYDLTIGAVGPQGEQGDPGDDGAPGDNGSSCSIEGTTVSCTDGTSANVRGPEGPTGPSGPVNVSKSDFYSVTGSGTTTDDPIPFASCSCDDQQDVFIQFACAPSITSGAGDLPLLNLVIVNATNAVGVNELFCTYENPSAQTVTISCQLICWDLDGDHVP